MKVTETRLPGVLLIEPRIFGDARGAFWETWNAARYTDAGVPATFVQDNVSRSSRGVLRGLHLQHPQAQGKLVQVLQGEVFDVAVDLRRGSSHFGQWVGVTLTGENAEQLWIPPGFHHGFCVLSETVIFSYKCTDFYAPQTELGVLWNDPEIGIDWPLKDPILSDKDVALPRLRDLSQELLPSVRDYAAA